MALHPGEAGYEDDFASQYMCQPVNTAVFTQEEVAALVAEKHVSGRNADYLLRLSFDVNDHERIRTQDRITVDAVEIRRLLAIAQNILASRGGS